MKKWQKWLLGLVVFCSLGFASGAALLFLLAPLDRWLTSLGWSQSGINRTLTLSALGWFVLLLLATLIYRRRALGLKHLRPPLAYGIPMMTVVVAAVVLTILLRAGRPWMAAQLGDIRVGRGGLVLAPDPERALQRYREGEFQQALPLLERLVASGSKDRRVHLSLARTYLRLGRNLDAAKTYRTMLRSTPEDPDAWEGFLGIYGYSDYRPDLPLSPLPRPRPAELQMLYRTHGEFFQALQGGEWQTVYLTGVNLGPARPGEFPSTASRDFGTYYGWFQDIGAMNANTIRVYSVLPPAFYQALKEYNRTARSPLWLIHEVWIHDQTRDLFDPESKRQFEQEVKNVVDLLHGQADIPCRPGANCGIYTADVSRYVIGLAIGREIEPVLALRTNRLHPKKTSYAGRYVSLPEGNPSEAWFAEECDFAIGYELERYNTQQPVTVVNWPPLDPLSHPTEATYAKELEFRKRDGEPVNETAPEEMNDADVVTLDVTRFQRGPEFSAGLFALYHVYQHWPDFLLHESSYAQAQDDKGVNRYLGYLRELKKVHRGFPLLIGEYGLSTSLGVAHLNPQGWNNGGFTEQGQAELLVRFTRNIRDTGYAGGLVFEWQDEWFKRVHDFYTADFKAPPDRTPLWDNQLDPEEHFGIVAHEPATTVPLLRGDPADWQPARVLYSRTAGAAGAGPINTVYAMTDSAYLYLRIDVDAPAGLAWKQWKYWIALNTLPGQAGSRTLPYPGPRVESGANFLAQLDGPGKARLLVAENYNPNHRIVIPRRHPLPRLVRKAGMNVELVDEARFEEIVIEANLPRYGRDGQWFPPQNFNRSSLPYGTAERGKPGYSNHALWRSDKKTGMIEVRIPWGLLFVTDPSSLQAFAGTDAQWRVKLRATPGVSVAVFALRAGSPGPLGGSFPEVVWGRVKEEPAIFTWDPWQKVEFRSYLKQGYYSLQREWERMQQPAGDKSSSTH